MSFEENIPEYALVPAKNPDQFEFVEMEKEEEPKLENAIRTPKSIAAFKESIKIVDNKMETDNREESVEVNALYTPVKINSVWKEEKHMIQIEEDILVPDTKADLREILLIDGEGVVRSKDILDKTKNEMKMQIKGDLNLQIIYKPEKKEGLPPLICINTKVPFQGQWKQEVCDIGNLEVEIEVEKIDYIVVNERKFRVKAELAVTTRLCEEKQIELFEGLRQEPVQLKKSTIEITDIALKKTDTMTIEDTLHYKESGRNLKEILKQSVSIVHGYKQITGEKIVINGFIYCNMLLLTEAIEDGCPYIEQYQGKIEFTQFVPINQSGPWSGSNITFDNSKLTLSIVRDEDEEQQIQIKGDLVTKIELYKNMEKEIVIDAYHMEKDFECNFEYSPYRTLIGNGVAEITTREIINIPEGIDNIERVVYAGGDVKNTEIQIDQGKVVVKGQIEGKIICSLAELGENESEDLMTLKASAPFKSYIEIPGIKENNSIDSTILMKDVWADKLNNNQLEYNCTAVVNIQAMETKQIKMLNNPRLLERNGDQSGRIVVYITKKDDDLWGIAKKFKTTVEVVKDINSLESEPEEGKKLLVVK